MGIHQLDFGNGAAQNKGLVLAEHLIPRMVSARRGDCQGHQDTDKERRLS